MNRTIRSRLKEIMENQEAEDVKLANEMAASGDVDAVKKRTEELAEGGPAIVPALLKSLCRKSMCKTPEHPQMC
jgi:hypothetical protein